MQEPMTVHRGILLESLLLSTWGSMTIRNDIIYEHQALSSVRHYLTPQSDIFLLLQHIHARITPLKTSQLQSCLTRTSTPTRPKLRTTMSRPNKRLQVQTSVSGVLVWSIDFLDRPPQNLTGCEDGDAHHAGVRRAFARSCHGTSRSYVCDPTDPLCTSTYLQVRQRYLLLSSA